MLNSYVVYDAGIDFGTQYLTKEAAYFLGNIFSSDEKITVSNQLYWIAPVRYNFRYASSLEIEQHFEFVKRISAPMGAQTLMAENIRGTSLNSGKFRLHGFGTYFRDTGLLELNNAIDGLKAALFQSPWSVQQAFMVGVFDGRGSIDIDKESKVIRYIVLDCPTPVIGSFLYDFFTSKGFSCNYNTARERVEGGAPRKSQLRIKNYFDYLSKLGFISPKRFAVVYESYIHNFGQCTIVDNSQILPGLRTITTR